MLHRVRLVIGVLATGGAAMCVSCSTTDPVTLEAAQAATLTHLVPEMRRGRAAAPEWLPRGRLKVAMAFGGSRPERVGVERTKAHAIEHDHDAKLV